MSRLNLKSTATPVLFAAPVRGSVEVAAYCTESGDRLISLATQVPFSPVDGEQMQMASSRRETITQRQIQNAFVSVGKCSHCNSKLVASASLADVIEAAGEDIHCPICTSSFTPRIDTMQLVKALAEEYAGGDEEEDGMPSDDEMFGGDEEEEPDFGEEEGEGEPGMDAEEETPDLDEDETDAVAALIASVRKSKRRQQARAFDEENEVEPDDEIQGVGDDGDMGDEVDPDFTGDDAGAVGDEGMGDEGMGEGELPDDTDPDMVDDNSEDLAAIAFLRRRIKHRKATAAAEEEDDSDSDSEVEEAASRLRKIIRKRRIKAVADDMDGLGEDGTEPMADDVEGEGEDMGMGEGDMGMDGGEPPVDDGTGVPGMGMGESPVDDDLGEDEDIGDNEQVVAALAKFVRNEYARRGIRYPTAATAAEMVDPLGLENNMNSDVTLDRMDDVTPGTGPGIDGDVNLGPGGDSITPGTDFTSQEGEFPPDTTIDENLHNDELSGDSLVDWRTTTSVELIASSATQDRWVMVDGRPIARLVRAKASAGVNDVWNTPALAASFMHVAKNGLHAADAKEFGFTPVRYRVTGTEAIRTAMRRASELSTENSQKLTAKSVDRHNQALRTSLVAAIKGVFPELKNPIRDRLAADLAKLGVHESRTIVDKAFASCVDEFATSLFAYADELAAKPDAARNETANFVAKAAFQSRDIDPSVGLTDSLLKGNRAATASAFVPQQSLTQVQSEQAQKDTTTSDRVRLAIRSIGR